MVPFTGGKNIESSISALSFSLSFSTWHNSEGAFMVRYNETTEFMSIQRPSNNVEYNQSSFVCTNTKPRASKILTNILSIFICIRDVYTEMENENKFSLLSWHIRHSTTYFYFTFFISFLVSEKQNVRWNEHSQKGKSANPERIQSCECFLLAIFYHCSVLSFLSNVVVGGFVFVAFWFISQTSVVINAFVFSRHCFVFSVFSV